MRNVNRGGRGCGVCGAWTDGAVASESASSSGITTRPPPPRYRAAASRLLNKSAAPGGRRLAEQRARVAGEVRLVAVAGRERRGGQRPSVTRVLQRGEQA